MKIKASFFYLILLLLLLLSPHPLPFSLKTSEEGTERTLWFLLRCSLHVFSLRYVALDKRLLCDYMTITPETNKFQWFHIIYLIRFHNKSYCVSPDTVWVLWNWRDNDTSWMRVAGGRAVRSEPGHWGGAQVLSAKGQSWQAWLCLMSGSPWSSIQDRVPWPSSTSPPTSLLQLLLRPPGAEGKWWRTHTQAISQWPYLPWSL